MIMEPDNRQNKEQKPERDGKKPEGQPPPPPASKAAVTWVVVIGMVLTMLLILFARPEQGREANYGELERLAASNRIKKAVVIEDFSSGSFIRAEVASENKGEADEVIRVNIASDGVKETARELRETFGVKDTTIDRQSKVLSQILTNVLPILLVFGLIYFFFIRQVRSAGHGAMSFGKSRAKMLNREKNKITFENVAGIEEAKEEVQEIIEFLKDPKRFQKLGGRIPKGVMLMGPPGTGKTLLARAIAGEADVPFFSISGSDFVEMFVGVGASRVRDMFEQGKKNAPCIVFIDEIDAVGRSRFTGIGGGHDEREQTLNALLVEMDGFETQEGVIILAATNRPDVLDPALMRPGRFDRQIVIDLPRMEGREKILKIHCEKINLSDDADLRRLARGTAGFSGADLENLLNEAALLAAREDKDGVEMSDLEEARDKVMWGREQRSRAMDSKEKERTAHHEAGHALVQQMMPGTEPLHKVTIIPRGMALGATMTLPEKDRNNYSETELLGMLATFMGGRITEEIFFEDHNSGASNDIQQATRIARHMVCEWGMSERLGPLSFGENKELMFLGREVSRSQQFSQKTAEIIDEEVARLVREASEAAESTIRENLDKLKMIAARVLEKETIDGRDVQEIVEHGRLLDEDEREAVDWEKEARQKAEEEAAGTPDPPVAEAEAEAAEKAPRTDEAPDVEATQSSEGTSDVENTAIDKE